MLDSTPRPDILIVDDSEMFCYLASLACREAGIRQTHCCGTIESALALIKSRPPQACLLDARLGMHLSTEVAAALHERDIPFAICSGDTPPRDFDPYIGMDMHLPKPLSFKSLTTAVKTLVERSVVKAA